MKLKTIKQISGVIRVETGLHIGAGSEFTQIGGVDNPIVRLVENQYPYIPGSSLKGKLRSLHELSKGNVKEDGRPHSCNNDKCVTCRLFGVGASETSKVGPCRIVVRDCMICEDDPTTKRVKDLSDGLPYTEEKTENAINRITGATQTKKGPLRKTERVPAGVAFNLDISLRIMDTDDDEEKLLDALKKSMRLLEKDGLGGSISRGYGKIRFENLTIDGKPFNLQEGQ